MDGVYECSVDRLSIDSLLTLRLVCVCVCVCVCVVDPNPQTRRRGLATKREAIAEARRDGARKLKAARAEGDAALEKVRSLVWTDYMPPPGRGVCVCVCVCVCVWTCVD